MRILNYDGLQAQGIPYSKVQLWRLEKVGKFPKRIPLGAARHGWPDEEIDEWIRGRIAARDASALAKPGLGGRCAGSRG